MRRNIDWNDKEAVRAYHREYAAKRYIPKKRKENKIDWNDKDARRAYDREYYAQKKKDYQKEYQKANKEKRREYNREYYKAHHKALPRAHKGTLVSNPDEIWKEIKGTDGWYLISNQKRVWSWRSGKMLKPAIGKNGYYYVKVGETSKLHHKLLAEAFIPNPHGYTEIDHIDTNPLNNDLSNLRWVKSHKENMNNPLTLEHFKESNKGKGSFSPDVLEKQRKPVLQYTLDGEFIKEYPSVRIAADETGANKASIAACCRGYRGTKSAGGFMWKFKKCG